jgi:hypothetical protein
MSYYIIHKIHDGDGFFAKFNHVLMHLHEADNLGLKPYIDFTKPSNLRDVNSTIQNEWEYCFNQEVIIEDVYKNDNLISDGLFKGWYPAQGKNFRDKNLTFRLNYLYEKYINVKPNILDKLNEDVVKFKTLAVHCRRSDMMKYHPNIGLDYSESTFLDKTLKVFTEGNFKKIYLATEEIDILKFFIDKLGDKIIYQTDCFRVKKDESPVFKNDPRPLHRTLQCQEVLIDALNMSKCDSLLCGVSGVSNGTIYINGLKFKDVYYFDEIEI